MGLLALAGGCHAVGEAKATLQELLNPVVVQGIALGFEEPELPGFAIPDTIPVASDVALGVFLADATELAALDETPIAGATLTLDLGNALVNMREELDGMYAVDPELEAIAYDEGARWDVYIEVPGRDEIGLTSVTLPGPVDVYVPRVHDAGTPMSVDLSHQGFDAWLAVVFDAHGNLTWSSEPETAEALAAIALGDDEVGVVTIPGEAFEADAIYGLGIAGLVKSSAEDEHNVNTVLSSMYAGKTRFFGVSTIPAP